MAGADITTDGAADAAIITAGPAIIIVATGDTDCAEATFGWLFAHSDTARLQFDQMALNFVPIRCPRCLR